MDGEAGEVVEARDGVCCDEALEEAEDGVDVESEDGVPLGCIV